METFFELLALCVGNSPMNSPLKSQWSEALKFSLICAWVTDWVNNREADDLRRHRAHYDDIVIRKMLICTIDSLLPHISDIHHFDVSIQKRRNYIVLAMEFRLFCVKPLVSFVLYMYMVFLYHHRHIIIISCSSSITAVTLAFILRMPSCKNSIAYQHF